MLVLTRKVGEKIIVNDKIEITVLKVQGKSISLGIKAPAGMRIARGELAVDAEELELAEPAGIA